MGRLCGGAHEISGIHTPLFNVGGWLEGSCGGWVFGGVGGLVVVLSVGWVAVGVWELWGGCLVVVGWMGASGGGGWLVGWLVQ